MRKNDGWLNALFALTFIAIPAVVGFYFLLPDWTNKYILSYGEIWAVGVGFILYVSILSAILIWLKVLAIESLNFNIPLALVFLSLFVSYSLPLYARGIIVFVLILLAFPINMVVGNLKKWIVKKNRN